MKPNGRRNLRIPLCITTPSLPLCIPTSESHFASQPPSVRLCIPTPECPTLHPNPRVSHCASQPPSVPL